MNDCLIWMMKVCFKEILDYKVKRSLKSHNLNYIKDEPTINVLGRFYIRSEELKRKNEQQTVSDVEVLPIDSHPPEQQTRKYHICSQQCNPTQERKTHLENKEPHSYHVETNYLTLLQLLWPPFETDEPGRFTQGEHQIMRKP